MDLGLQNQVAIIFGGTSGVGLATAHALQAEGAKVAIGGRSPERLSAALASFPQGAPVLGKTVDVTAEREVAGFVDAALARWGRVDVVVNAAGQSLMRPFFAVDDADWHAQWALKVMAVVYAVRAVVPAMQAQGGGVIINLNST
ncbi:MAG: SDR family NAD(P)-dependent oxidoreductase, partial [Firmicutes bacterium]|nr:SDR family NAD(P)-dependent oxidoreductase [Bacillota bacterium]